MAKIDNKVKDTSTKPSKKLWILPVAVGSVAAVLIGLFTWQLIKNNNRGGGGGTQSTCKLKFDSDNCKLLTKDNQEIKTIDLEAGKPYTFKIEQTDYELFDAPNNISMSSPNDDYLYNYSNGEITLTINEDATLGAIAPYAATHFISVEGLASETGDAAPRFNHITFGDTEKYPFSIDWGDGDVIEYDPNDPDIDYYNDGVSHEYKQDGTYDVTIYGAVNSIMPQGQGLRKRCEHLIIGDKIKCIEESCFLECYYRDAYISEGVKKIEDRAFQSAQLEKVYLPSTLDYIGLRSFGGVFGVDVKIAPHTNLSALASNFSDRCLFHSMFLDPISSQAMIRARSIYIGRNSIFDAAEGEFYDFEYLQSIVFEDDDCNMVYLAKNVFQYNHSLTNFTCPKNIIYIDDQAFVSGLNALRTIKLSPKLQYIGEKAFSGPMMSRIEFTSKEPPSIHPGAFAGLINNDYPFRIIVPKGCAQKYINAWRSVIDTDSLKVLLYIEEANI